MLPFPGEYGPGLYSMGTRSENDTAQDCIFRNGGGNHGDGSLNLLNGLDQIGALQFDVVGKGDQSK